MKKFSKSAFIAIMALVYYAGFAAAQVVSFDNPGDLSTLVNGLKAGGPGGGPGNHIPNPPAPVHQNGGFGHQDHGNNGPGNHGGPGPQQPGPWHPGPQQPYSMYRTVCTVTPGISAKAFITEQTMPFYGKAVFYYYNAFDTVIGTSNPINSIFSGGNGTPIFDFYQVPSQAERCFLAITRN